MVGAVSHTTCRIADLVREWTLPQRPTHRERVLFLYLDKTNISAFCRRHFHELYKKSSPARDAVFPPRLVSFTRISKSYTFDRILP